MTNLIFIYKGVHEIDPEIERGFLVPKSLKITDLVGFTVAADHRVKMKVGEKINKYLDLVKELLNRKVRVIPIVIAVIETVFKDFQRKKTCKNWKSEELRPYRPHDCQNQLEYLEESWRPEENYCHFHDESLVKTDLKN